jgi:FkbM family methyltransferase
MFLRMVYPFQSGLGTVANSQLLRRLDGNPSGSIIARSGRFKLVVPQDDYVGRSIKYFGDLDKKVTWVVNKVLQPGDTALDIGANLGLVAFKMLERVGPSGKVIAFEPQSRMTDFIAQSIAQNSIKNLHLQKMGLADAPATLQLSIPEHNAGAASFVSEGGALFEEVPVTTLDDFHQKNGLNGVRLIKIDVEGYESRVFKGGKAFLASVKPDVIIFEENQRTGEIPDSVSFIQSYGYDVFSMPKAWFTITLQPFQPDADGHDFVAIHKDAPAALRRKLGVA